MSAFSFRDSIARAEGRLSGAARRRADRGRSRSDPEIEREIERLLGGVERPAFAALHRELTAFCRSRGVSAPSRSTLYNAVDRVPVPRLRWEDLPVEVQRSLYNVDPGHSVDGDVVAFYALNYGNGRALSFAAGLPWLCLSRASGRSGWRPKARALLAAVMSYRGIS